MNRKVGKERESEGGSKKPKEVGNESPLASMFQKQQTANKLQKAREAHLSILEKGKQLGLHEEAYAEPLCRSENDAHPMVEFFTSTLHHYILRNPTVFSSTLHHYILSCPW